MKTKVIQITDINVANQFVNLASAVDGHVTLMRGQYAVDAKSILGVMAINIAEGVIVEYPTDAIEFEKFISDYEI